MMVSLESLQAFLVATNSPAGAAPTARTNRQREAAIKKAEAECAAAGI